MLLQTLYPPCLGLKTPGHLFHLDPAAQPRVTARLEAGLGRSLTQYESDVLTHARSVGGIKYSTFHEQESLSQYFVPRICLVCHSADQASLQNCPRCHCVAYCSAACREEDSALHGSVCSSLQHCIQDYSLQRTRGGCSSCSCPHTQCNLGLPCRGPAAVLPAPPLQPRGTAQAGPGV